MLRSCLCSSADRTWDERYADPPVTRYVRRRRADLTFADERRATPERGGQYGTTKV